MTIHHVRLGPDLLQGARDDKHLLILGSAFALFFSLLALVFLSVMTVYLWLAVQSRSSQAWSDFWSRGQNIQMIGLSALFIPLSIGLFSGTRLVKRIARRYALLGDDHWAPALDVQPAPLTPAEQAEDILDFGTVYDPRANLAPFQIIFGVLLVASGGGLAYLFTWWIQQLPPVPPGDLAPAMLIVTMMCMTVVACVALGGWLLRHGVRSHAGVYLTGDHAALYLRNRRGRERARIPWHEMRAFTARPPGTGADRTIYSLDTGDRTVVWGESRFDPPAVRDQRSLLRRAIVTRANLPLRDSTRVYSHVPAMFRDPLRLTRFARFQVDAAAPTAHDRAIWRPMRALWRLEQALALFGAILLVIALLLDPIAFVLQHLLG